MTFFLVILRVVGVLSAGHCCSGETISQLEESIIAQLPCEKNLYIGLYIIKINKIIQQKMSKVKFYWPDALEWLCFSFLSEKSYPRVALK